MFSWERVEDRPGAVIAPEQRLAWPRTIGLGAQHVLAMFGATFLVPVLTGFPPNTTLLFSGIGTIAFLLITQNKLPSYLGSSFAFVSPVLAAATPGDALGGVIAVGLLLMLVGVWTHLAGPAWIDWLMPPVVAGAIVALIGFNLAPAARDNYVQQPVTATITLLVTIVATVLFRGMLGRMSIVVGVVLGYIVAALRGEVDTSAADGQPWIGLPTFTSPSFDPGLLPIFLPVVLVLVAENVGHIRAVGQLTDRDLGPLTGRALFADGLATVFSGSGGGSGTTTYGENIGVMAATRMYSTAAYWVAAVVAIMLGMSPKIGALIASIPPGVLGGVTVVLYGLIGIIGIRIWVDNKVDFSKPANQVTAAVALVLAIADFTLKAGDFVFGGIALGSVAAVVVYHLTSWIARKRGTG